MLSKLPFLNFCAATSFGLTTSEPTVWNSNERSPDFSPSLKQFLCKLGLFKFISSHFVMEAFLPIFNWSQKQTMATNSPPAGWSRNERSPDRLASSRSASWDCATLGFGSLMMMMMDLKMMTMMSMMPVMMVLKIMTISLF